MLCGKLDPLLGAGQLDGKQNAPNGEMYSLAAPASLPSDG